MPWRWGFDKADQIRMMDRVVIFRHWFASYHPLAQPRMTRPSYARELVTSATFPIALAMVEGSVIAVLADKIFNVGQFAFATIMLRLCSPI